MKRSKNLTLWDSSWPKSVKVVLGSLILLLVLYMAAFFAALFIAFSENAFKAVIPPVIGVVLICLLLSGASSRHILVWQWGRVLAPMGGLASLAAGLVVVGTAIGNMLGLGTSFGAFEAIMVVVSLLMLIQAATLLVVFVALGRPSAHQYFGVASAPPKDLPERGLFTETTKPFSGDSASGR